MSPAPLAKMGQMWCPAGSARGHALNGLAHCSFSDDAPLIVWTHRNALSPILGEEGGVNVRSCGERTRWLLCAFAVSFAIGAFGPEYARAQAGTELVFLIDQERLVDDAPLRRAILESSVQSAAMEVDALKEREALPQLVSRVYGYGVTQDSQRYKEVQLDLVKAIASLNSIKDLNKVPAGAPLRLPLFVKRPLTRGSNPSLAQVLNLTPEAVVVAPSEPAPIRKTSYTVATSDGSALWSRRATTLGSNPVSDAILRSAEKALLRVSLEQVQRFGGLPALRERIKSGTLALPPNTEMYEVSLGQAPPPAPAGLALGGAAPAPSQPKPAQFTFSAEQLAALRSAKGSLYLLDTFSKDGSTCSHGDLVREKAVQTLRKLGLESEVGRIKTLSVDFYANRAANIEYVRKWIAKSFRPPALDTYKLALAELEKASPPANVRPGAVTVPGLFLQAIYGTLSEDENTLVVSGSFYTVAPDNIFPKDIVLNPRANFVNAVLNDAVAIEAEPQAATEPLQTFNRYRESLGTVLVGYFDETGRAQGMYSAKGEGVTAIDDGTVSGEQGGCRGKQDRGASFAAPVVAVKLLVGRLLWPQGSDYTDAIAARQRLLRSASVRKDYLGKYWAAGPSAPERLYAPTGHFFVRPDGTRADAKKFAGRLTLTVEVDLSTGPKRVPYLFDPEDVDPSPGFSALSLESDQAFLLVRPKGGSASWFLTRPVGLCLCVDDKKVLSIPEALSTFKEVVRND